MNLVFKCLVPIVFSAACWAQDNRIEVQDQKSLAAIGQLVALLPPSLNLKDAPIYDSLTLRRFQENSKKGLTTKYSFCSAALIPTEQIVSAGHCAEIFYLFAKLKVTVNFVPAGFGSGLSRIKQIFKFGGFGYDKIIKNDWAVLDLVDKLPKVKPLKFMKLRKENEMNIELISAGYPQVVRGQIYENKRLFTGSCRILNEQERQSTHLPEVVPRAVGVYATNCFVSVGNSGGPILARMNRPEGSILFIVGINVASYRNEASGLGFAVPAETILNAIAE